MSEILPVGTIVRSKRVHGAPFGVVAEVRKQQIGRPELGWGEHEYRLDHRNGYTWVDENFVEVTTLAEVQTYYDEREKGYLARIRKLRDMVGRKVPKFNPAKHLGGMAERMCDAYRHEDGSLTYIMWDPNPQDTESPRSYDGNVATMIQLNSRCISIDDDDAYLGEARDRFDEQTMRRYLAIFRPDILYYTDHWSAGDSYGWGYVTRENWERWMGEDYDGDVTPEQAFDQEVRVYGLWARGEVYGSGHIAKRGDEVDMVFGHLGYDRNEDIARNYTDSPILEVLA